MDGASLHRLRWRLRGAWLWPAFVALTIADAVVGHMLPPAGDGQSVVSAALVALVLNLIAVILLSRPLGAVLRRARGDLPGIVARDYAGTTVVVVIALALLTAGLLHRSTLQAQRSTMDDAIKRAQAYIGDRAPAQFRRNLAARGHIRDPAGQHLPDLRPQRRPQAHLLRDRQRQASICAQRQLRRV